MRKSNHRKFFRRKNRNNAVCFHRDRILHSFCYTESGMIIESLIFDKPIEDADDFRLRRDSAGGCLGIEFESFMGGISEARFKAKYSIGDIVKFPCKKFIRSSKFMLHDNELYPYSARKQVSNFEKRRVTGIEVAYDDAGKHKTQIIYILYQTEEV